MRGDGDDGRQSMISRIWMHLRTMDRQALFWIVFVIVVLLAGLIVIVFYPGSSAHCGDTCGGN